MNAHFFLANETRTQLDLVDMFATILYVGLLCLTSERRVEVIGIGQIVIVGSPRHLIRERAEFEG